MAVGEAKLHIQVDEKASKCWKEGKDANISRDSGARAAQEKVLEREGESPESEREKILTTVGERCLSTDDAVSKTQRAQGTESILLTRRQLHRGVGGCRMPCS